MKSGSNGRLKKVYTGHVWANSRNCTACWACIGACPQAVIGKVSFLWHRHIVIKKGENCNGCKKCIKTCPHGVFSEDVPDVFKKHLSV